MNQLSKLVKSVGDKLGYNVKVKNINNPRVEQENHYYNPKYQGLIELGVKPNYLTDKNLTSIFKVVSGYKDHIDESVIVQGIKW